MTCIVGLEHNGNVYLAGDSIAIEDYQAFSVIDSKVFAIGELIIGFCGSFRAGQLLKYGLELPVHSKNKSDIEYLVIDFVDAVRTLYAGKGILKKEHDEEKFDGKFLIGYRGCLYFLDEDFSVGRSKTPYCAVGVASDVALGSLFSTENIIDPKERLTIALSACVKWNAGVREPFNFVSSENQQKTKTKTNK